MSRAFLCVGKWDFIVIPDSDPGSLSRCGEWEMGNGEWERAAWCDMGENSDE